MTYTFYKLFHFIGIFMVLLSLGAIASHRLQGGTKDNFKNRKLFMILHGVGLVLAFIAGFGLIAKAGFSFSSGWIYIKLLVWFILGAYPAVFYKQKQDNKLPFVMLLVWLLIALLFVEYKYF